MSLQGQVLTALDAQGRVGWAPGGGGSGPWSTVNVNDIQNTNTGTVKVQNALEFGGATAMAQVGLAFTVNTGVGQSMEHNAQGNNLLNSALGNVVLTANTQNINLITSAAGGNINLTPGSVSGVVNISGGGKLQYADGNQGLDKVLQSDASGVASWKSLAELFVTSGTYVPTFSSGVVGFSYSNNYSTYIRVGRITTVTVSMQVRGTDGSPNVSFFECFFSLPPGSTTATIPDGTTLGAVSGTTLGTTFGSGLEYDSSYTPPNVIRMYSTCAPPIPLPFVLPAAPVFGCFFAFQNDP